MMQQNWYKPIPFQQAGEDPSTPYNLPEVSGICVTSHQPSSAEAYTAVHQQHQMDQMKAVQRQQQMGVSMPPPSRVTQDERSCYGIYRLVQQIEDKGRKWS
jgi:hypothetical protein